MIDKIRPIVNKMNYPKEEQTRQPTTTIRFADWEVHTSPERARQYLEDKKTADWVNQVERSSSVYENNPNLPGAILNGLAYTAFVAGSVCVGAAALCSNWDLFKTGLEMAIPGGAYLVGRADGIRKANSQRR